VIRRRGIELLDPSDALRSVTELLGALNAQLGLGMLWEPPGADPHARCCGEGELDAPLYSISASVTFPLSRLFSTPLDFPQLHKTTIQSLVSMLSLHEEYRQR
jgi:hypothetical protein